MSRIGIIDADLMDNGTRHPNLALMKISGFYKEQGHEVNLIYKNYEEVRDYDKLFMSKVFSFTKVPNWVLELPNIEIGGTGFFGDSAPNLPDEIEHHMPDYHLYDKWVKSEIESGKQKQHYIDYTDFSIGFTTRGCFRKCSFCVNKKYDHVFRHSHVEEFFDPSRPNIYLWDDNILGFPQWEEVIDELDATGRPYQFRQGVDIRLMTDRKAMRLNNAKWYGDFIFAFDHMKDKDIICEKVQLWKRYSTKVCKMYVLSGYESQDINDIVNIFERIRLLMYYGSLPYIMRYEEYKNSKLKGMYIQLARWCNQPSFFKKKSFRQYCEANQEYQYKGKMDKYCASYQVMIDFEKQYPEVAAKYFDLRFEDENMYLHQYGYGRKYANKTSCKECRKKYITWNDFINENTDIDKLLELYFSKEIDLQCTSYSNSQCVNGSMYSQKLLKILKEYSNEGLIKVIRRIEIEEKDIKENILATNMFEVVLIIVEFLSIQDNQSYKLKDLKEKIVEICKERNIEFTKNVELYLKFAAQCDLISFSMNRSNSEVRMSILGKSFIKLPEYERKEVIYKLSLRYTLIQQYILSKEIEFLKPKDRKILNDISRHILNK